MRTRSLAAEPGLAQAADGFQPAEDLLDPFALFSGSPRNRHGVWCGRRSPNDSGRSPYRMHSVPCGVMLSSRNYMNLKNQRNKGL
jgi:hypothetical protein